MRKALFVAVSVAVTSLSQAVELKTEDQKINYSIGAQIGQSLSSVEKSTKIDREVLFEAIGNVLDKKELKLTQKEMAEVMQSFSKRQIEAQKKELEELSSKNKEEGEKFLEEYKKEEGVKVTDSGLQYKALKKGDGKIPKLEDTVKVNYEGTLPNGEKFDSSYDRGSPVEFKLGQVIEGWQEGLQLMPVGSTYELVIPANLAYGTSGPGVIGPNRVLKFKVDLLDIIKAEEKKEESK